MSTALINACDAGREGELIFRYIVQHAKAKQADPAPVAAVDDAGGDPRRLRAAAQRRGDAAAGRRRRCRSEADWLVGINGTRAMTAFNSQDGRLPPDHRRPRADADAGDRGRARGAIRAFVPRDYWEVRATLRRQGRRVRRALVRRTFKQRRGRPGRSAPSGSGTRRAPRPSSAACRGKPGAVTEEAKPTTQTRAAAVRPDQPAARGQRPLRLLGHAPRCRWRRRCTRGTRC